MLAMGNAIAAYLDSPAPTLPPTHERGRLLDSASPAEAIWKSYTAMPECASWWESYATDPAAMWRAQVRHAAKKATSKGDAKRKKENAKRKEPATKRGAGGGACVFNLPRSFQWRGGVFSSQELVPLPLRLTRAQSLRGNRVLPINTK
jgi:hypothetical protein